MTVEGWDSDGDGYQESLLVNTDADAAHDAVASDTDRDGVTDTLWVDADNNGVVEATGHDANEDGVFDQVWKDSDQDGVTDTGTDVTIHSDTGGNSVIPSGQPGGTDLIIHSDTGGNSVIPSGQPGGTTINIAGPPLGSGGTGLDALVNSPQYQSDPDFRDKVDQMLESQRRMVDNWVEPDDDHDDY